MMTLFVGFSCMRIVRLVFWPENYLRNLSSFVSCELHVTTDKARSEGIHIRGCRWNERLRDLVVYYRSQNPEEIIP